MYGGNHRLFEGLERPPRPLSTQAGNQARQPSSVSYPTATFFRLPERTIREHSQSLKTSSATAPANNTPKPYRTNSEPVNPSNPQTLPSYGPYPTSLNAPLDQNNLSRARYFKLLGIEYPYLQTGPRSCARHSADEGALQLNTDPASNASSHHYYAQQAQYPPLRIPEYNGNASNSAYPTQRSNTLHNLGNENLWGYGTNETSTLNRVHGPAWKNVGYGGPLGQSQSNFDKSRHEGPRETREMSEVLVSPRSSRQEPDFSTQSRESADRDKHTTSETMYDEHDSANNTPIVPPLPEHGGYVDPGQNFSSMQPAPQNSRCSNGTLEEGYSSASRDTASSDSLSCKDWTSFSSVSDDYKANPTYLPSQNAISTSINLARSFQNREGFHCEVHVWQDDGQCNPEFKERLKFVTLLFDTQCQGSNWVAQKIVNELGATVEEFSPPAEFIGFNGYSMKTSRRTSLSFKNSHGGSRYKAAFLVSAVGEVPFDMLLGADDCLMLKIIGPPRLLGLAGPVERKEDKQVNIAAAERHAKEKRRVEREGQKLRDKKKMAQKKKEDEEMGNENTARRKEEERKAGQQRSERRFVWQ